MRLSPFQRFSPWIGWLALLAIATPGWAQSPPAETLLTAPQQLERAQTALREVRNLRDAGEILRAREMTVELLEDWKSQYGEDSLPAACATVWLVDSYEVAHDGDPAQIAELMEWAIGVYETHLPRDHPGWGHPLIMQAAVLLQAGDFRAAKDVLNRAVALLQRYPDEESMLAYALSYHAYCLLRLEELPAAEAAASRSMEIRERLYGFDSQRVAWNARQLANIAQRRGDYRQTLSYLDRVASIWRRVHGEKYIPLGNVYLEQGWTYFLMGDYASAQRLFESVLRLHEPNLAPHEQLGWVWADLGSIAFATRDYAEARRFHEKSLEVRRTLLAPDHADIAASHYNLAETLLAVGDLVGADQHIQRAMQIQRDRYGDLHTEVANGLRVQGKIALAQNDAIAAIAYLEESLGIRADVVGPEHSGQISTLIALGHAYETMGRPAPSRASFEEAARIAAASLSADHLQTGIALAELAACYERNGELEPALAIARSAAKIEATAYGKSARPYAALFTVARLQHATGRTSSALQTALRAEQLRRDHFRLVAAGFSERQVMAYYRGQQRPQNVILGAICDGAGTASSELVVAWEQLASSRALVFEEMARRHRSALAREASGEHDAASALDDARQNLANLVLRGPDREDADEYRALVALAQREKDAAERRLLDEGASQFSSAPRRVTLSGAAAALPPRSALVSFYEFAQAQGERQYVALVTKSNPGEVTVHPVALGSASEIERRIAGWRQELVDGEWLPERSPAQSERACRTRGEEVRRAVWDPLVPHLGSSDHVFLVPAGALLTINFATLPTEERGYLVEDNLLLHVLSTERDLLESAPASTGGLLAMGGINYEGDVSVDSAPPAANAPRAASPRTQPRATCIQPPGTEGFAALPASQREAEQVVRTWSGPSLEVALVVGAEASEETFYRRAPGRRVLHLATHAFFAATCADQAAEFTNPLLQSGVVLAGANRLSAVDTGGFDGILTAEEIAGVDLSATEWAVLSACSSGQGALVRGEGVLGLARSFRVAGASAVVMSLWPVQDEPTRAWMGELYRARFTEARSTSEAVRLASRTILAQRRRHRLSTHPAYWGAFVAVGNPN